MKCCRSVLRHRPWAPQTWWDDLLVVLNPSLWNQHTADTSCSHTHQQTHKQNNTQNQQGVCVCPVWNMGMNLSSSDGEASFSQISLWSHQNASTNPGPTFHEFLSKMKSLCEATPAKKQPKQLVVTAQTVPCKGGKCEKFCLFFFLCLWIKERTAIQMLFQT